MNNANANHALSPDAARKLAASFKSNAHANSFLTALKTIVMLSQSQSLYSRLRDSMEEQDWMPLCEICRDNYFADEIDFINWIEG